MKYLYIRPRDAEGHLSNKGGVTVAFDVDDNVLWYTSATCSKKDQFNRKIGRSIATGRFDKGIAGEGPIGTVVLASALLWKDVVDYLVKEHSNVVQ